MTYEQFWEQDCELVKYYRKAAQIRQDLRNQDAWLQGSYFYEALVDVAPVLHAFAKKGTKPQPYVDSPYPISQAGMEEAKTRKEKAVADKGKRFMEAFMAKNNQRFEERK